MGNKEFHEMLGILIDTDGTTKIEAVRNATNKEEEIKRIANQENIQLEQKDITDLVNCIDELHKIKSSVFARSPRN